MGRLVATSVALLTLAGVVIGARGFDDSQSMSAPSTVPAPATTQAPIELPPPPEMLDDVEVSAQAVLEPHGITLDEYEKPERCPQFIPLFKKYGLEPVDTFSFIAWRETRCNPDLINATFDSSGRPVKTLNRDGSYDVGLLQINSTWKTVTHEVCGTPWGDMFALLNIDCNLKVAKYLLDNGGLGHWSL